MSDNLLEVEDGLIDLVKAAAPDLGGRVYSGTDLEAVNKQAKIPMAIVLFGGYTVADQRSHDKKAKLGQTWLVVVVGRNVRSKDGKATRDQVGPIMAQVMTGLMGEKPTQTASELELGNPPEPFYDENGFGYFPLLFTTTKIVK